MCAIFRIRKNCYRFVGFIEVPIPKYCAIDVVSLEGFRHSLSNSLITQALIVLVYLFDSTARRFAHRQSQHTQFYGSIEQLSNYNSISIGSVKEP